MRTRGYLTASRFVPLALAVVALLGMGIVSLAVQAAEATEKIEIDAKDKEWKVSGYTLTDEPTEIVVRNEDTVTHGFNSSLFKYVNAKMEGGYLAKGKGPNVYRVDPGKTMILRFTKGSEDPPESFTYAFWCDLHPHMKGEVFILEVKGENVPG